MIARSVRPAGAASRVVLDASKETRNFNRSWDVRVKAAGVRRITVHNARRSCASMLAVLDVLFGSTWARANEGANQRAPWRTHADAHRHL